MSAAFEADFIATEDQLVEAFRLIGKRRHGRIVVPLLWLGVMLCVLLLVLLGGGLDHFFSSPLRSGLTGAAGILLLLLLSLYAAIPWLRRRSARNTLATNPGFEGSIRVAFDDSGFRNSTAYSSGDYPWEKLYGWRESDSIVMVQPTPQLFYLVPRSILDDAALDNLRAGLARSRKGRLDA